MTVAFVHNAYFLRVVKASMFSLFHLTSADANTQRFKFCWLYIQELWCCEGTTQFTWYVISQFCEIYIFYMHKHMHCVYTFIPLMYCRRELFEVPFLDISYCGLVSYLLKKKNAYSLLKFMLFFLSKSHLNMFLPFSLYYLLHLNKWEAQNRNTHKIADAGYHYLGKVRMIMLMIMSKYL